MFLLPEPEVPIFGNDLVRVTREAAAKVSGVFRSLHARGVDRRVAQHFALQSVVAMFSEDIGLLPSKYFTRTIQEARNGRQAYDLRWPTIVSAPDLAPGRSAMAARLGRRARQPRWPPRHGRALGLAITGVGMTWSMADYGHPSRSAGGLGDPYGAPVRWLSYVGDICMVGAGVSVAVNVGTGWAWPLFVWGLAIGLLGPPISEILRRFAVSYLRLTPEEVAKSRARVKAHRLLIIPTGVALGLTIGLFAASLMAAWVDQVATVIAVLALLPVLIQLPALKRKRQGHTGQA
jgi:hypothetical protein